MSLCAAQRPDLPDPADRRLTAPLARPPAASTVEARRPALGPSDERWQGL